MPNLVGCDLEGCKTIRAIDVPPRDEEAWIQIQVQNRVAVIFRNFCCWEHFDSAREELEAIPEPEPEPELLPPLSEPAPPPPDEA